MSRARSLLALATMAALTASAPLSCRGTTALHFVVCFDFDAASSVRLIRVKINNAAGVSLTSSTGQEITVTSETQFPLRFSVYATSSVNEAVSVTVDALTTAVMGGPSMRVDYSARAIARFVPGEIRTVPIVVQRACTGMIQCPADQSCVNGACMAVEAATTAYAANATCGEANTDASVNMDATVPVDGGDCLTALPALTIPLPQDITRVTHLAVASNGAPGSGVFRVAALAQSSMGPNKLILARARLGANPALESMPGSSAIVGASRALSFTRSTVIASTDTRVYFSADGNNATLLAPWNDGVGTAAIAGTFAGMGGNEVQICTFLSGNLNCKSYSEGVGTLTSLAMDPPPVLMSVGDATFLSIDESVTTMSTPLIGVIRTANSLGRCAVVSMGTMPTCATIMGLPSFTAATAALTSDTGLAIATVDNANLVRAAVVPSTLGAPSFVSLGNAAANATLTAAVSSSNDVLVAASDNNRVSLLRRFNDGRAGAPSAIAVNAASGQPIALLRRSESLPSLGEHFVLAYLAAPNLLQVRAIPAAGCR